MKLEQKITLKRLETRLRQGDKQLIADTLGFTKQFVCCVFKGRYGSNNSCDMIIRSAELILEMRGHLVRKIEADILINKKR
jgi:hypothetical protein